LSVAMPRSVWKIPFFDGFLIKKVARFFATPEKERRAIRIWTRRSTILPDFVGAKFEVHNGKIFHSVNISPNMVGHKFGEFSPTRKKPKFPDLKKDRAAALMAKKKPEKKDKK